MTSASRLPLAHVLLAVAVAAVWGTNFVVIRIALAHLPPFLFATLRFTFALLPAIFFLKRPAVPWTHLAAYGVTIGAGQFGLLYIAMAHSISPGLASLVVQTQVFFTIGFAMWFAGERIRTVQVVALGMGAVGLGIVAVHRGGDVTPLGLVLVLLAAACWAGGNLIARAGGPVNMLAYVVWSSLFAVPPLLALSLLFDGVPAIVQALRNADGVTWASVLYQSIGNSLFGYASWAWLLARHPAATVSPFALLVPVFGIATSALVMAEPLQGWKIAAGVLVLSGLALDLAWPKRAVPA